MGEIRFRFAVYWPWAERPQPEFRLAEHLNRRGQDGREGVGPAAGVHGRFAQERLRCDVFIGGYDENAQQYIWDRISYPGHYGVYPVDEG